MSDLYRVPGALVAELEAADFDLVDSPDNIESAVRRRDGLTFRSSWASSFSIAGPDGFIGRPRPMPEQWVVGIDALASSQQPAARLELGVWPRRSSLVPAEPGAERAVFGTGQAYEVELDADSLAVARLQPRIAPLAAADVAFARRALAPVRTALAALPDHQIVAVFGDAIQMLAIWWVWSESASTVKRVADAIAAWRG